MFNVNQGLCHISMKVAYLGSLPRVPIGTVGLQTETRVYKDNWS